MQALENLASFDVPRALIESESQRLADAAREDMMSRGMNVKDAPIPPELFKDQAMRRVRLGLLVGEIVRDRNFTASAEQVRALVEEMASAYERPDDFINWFMNQPRQRADVEAAVIENQLVDWILTQAKVTDRALTVEELMAEGAQA
jgi:trigger factor